MKEYLKQFVNSYSFAKDEMTIIIENMMHGKYSEAQIAGFLMALAIKPLTPEELARVVTIMRKNSKAVFLSSEEVVDIVGTGGSAVDTFNISTAAMFITAGAGVPVAKHGNRSINGSVGSSDVLEMLGVNIHLKPEEIAEVMQRIQICYLYGPILNHVFRHVLSSRSGLGIPTLFNLLEPMTNPAGARGQLIGVNSPSSMELMAQAFALLKDAHVMLVHGHDGMDEVTTQAVTSVIEVHGSSMRRYQICPEQFGLKRAAAEELKASDLTDRVEIIRGIMGGRRGAKRDIAVLNAAAAIYISGHAADMMEGMKMANDSLDSGRAQEKLEALADLSQRY